MNAKSCIKYSFLLDRRDPNGIPTCGNSVKFTTETAGLGGSTKHVKFELGFLAASSYTLFFKKPYTNIFVIKENFWKSGQYPCLCAEDSCTTFLIDHHIQMTGLI